MSLASLQSVYVPVSSQQKNHQSHRQQPPRHPDPARHRDPFSPPRQRHQVAVAENDEAGPGGGRGAAGDHVALGGAEGGGHAQTLPQMAVEAVEELGGLVVAQAPEAGDHGVGAGLEEGAGEAHHPFPSQQGPGVAAAGGEHDDAAVEAEVDDLADLQQAVLIGGPGRQQHPGAVRIGLVGHRVGGEVQHPEPLERGGLHEDLGGVLPQALDAAAAEVAHHGAALRPGVGERPQADAGGEDGHGGALPRRGELDSRVSAGQGRIGEGERGDGRHGGPPPLPAQPERGRGHLHQLVAGGERRRLGPRAERGERELVKGVVRHQDQPPDARGELAQGLLQQAPVEPGGGGRLGAVPAVEGAVEEADRRPQLAAPRQPVGAGAAAGRHQQPGTAGEIPPLVLPGGDLEREEGLVVGERLPHPRQGGEVRAAGGMKGRGGAGELIAQIRLLDLQPFQLPVRGGAVGGGKGGIEEPALHGRDPLHRRAPLLPNGRRGGGNRMGGLQSVDQERARRRSAIWKARLEVLRPALLEARRRSAGRRASNSPRTRWRRPGPDRTIQPAGPASPRWRRAPSANPRPPVAGAAAQLTRICSRQANAMDQESCA